MIAPVIALLFFLGYGYLWLMLYRGVRKLDWSGSSTSPKKSLSISILVAHHNDFEALTNLLRHLEQNFSDLDIPVFLVSDYSDQQAYTSFQEQYSDSSLNLHFFSNQDSRGKKQAIAFALERIESRYILQLDADVLPNENLFSLLKEQLSEEPEILVARVAMIPSHGFWSRLAALDYCSMQLSTFAFLAQGRPIMASGATLVYERKSFLRHKDIGADWQSGEDTFLLQAIGKENKSQVAYSPRLFSETPAPQAFRSFIKQRLRWGAKSRAYPSHYAKAIALLVASLNLFLVFGFVASLFYAYPWYWLFVLSFKLLGDWFLLKSFTQQTGEERLLKSYLGMALVYPFYISLVVLFIPFAPKTKWL